jgi:hypothetical protein
MSIVFGDQDEIATPERMAHFEARVSHLGCRIIRFKGGHQLNKTVLSQLAKMSA